MTLRLLAILTLMSVLGVTAQILAAAPETKRAPTSDEAAAGESDEVVYNARTKTIHTPTCHWAEKCRTGCSKLPRKEAVEKGGTSCKSCRG